MIDVESLKSAIPKVRVKATLLCGTVLLALLANSPRALATAITSMVDTSPPCTNTLKATILSPDKQWRAQRYLEYCTGNYAIETDRSPVYRADISG